MANIKSAEKRVRIIERQTAINRARRTKIRNLARNVEKAISSGIKEDALAALKALQPEFMRGVTKGVFKKNTASRKISRLNAQIKSLA